MASSPLDEGGECACLVGRQFVKPINEHSSKSLRLPLRFASHAQETGMTRCRLIGPLKHRWEVELLKDDEGCSLGDGWESFYKAHTLKPGCIVTFKYVGKGSFKVTIFDAVAGESMYGNFTWKVKKDPEAPVESSGLVSDAEETVNHSVQKKVAEKKGKCVASEIAKKIGRPRNPRPDWKDEKMVKLRGTYLSSMNVFRLKQELTRRNLSPDGFKDLVEQLGDYLVKKRTEVVYPKQGSSLH